jgi:hypothetical protein
VQHTGDRLVAFAQVAISAARSEDDDRIGSVRALEPAWQAVRSDQDFFELHGRYSLRVDSLRIVGARARASIAKSQY